MPAAVVVQRHGRVAQALQLGAMVVGVARPLQVVHAKAMHQHQHAAGGRRQRLGQGVTGQAQALTGQAHRHRDRQWVVGGDQVVAKDAVQRRQRGLAPRRCWRLGRPWRPVGHAAVNQPHRRANALAHQFCRAAHSAIHRARDAAGSAWRHLADDGRTARDVAVHLLDQVGDAQRGIKAQLRQAANIAQADGRRWAAWDLRGGGWLGHGWRENEVGPTVGHGPPRWQAKLWWQLSNGSVVSPAMTLGLHEPATPGCGMGHAGGFVPRLRIGHALVKLRHRLSPPTTLPGDTS